MGFYLLEPSLFQKPDCLHRLMCPAGVRVDVNHITLLFFFLFVFTILQTVQELKNVQICMIKKNQALSEKILISRLCDVSLK